MSLSDDLFPQDDSVEIVHDRHCMDNYNLIGRIKFDWVTECFGTSNSIRDAFDKPKRIGSKFKK